MSMDVPALIPAELRSRLRGLQLRARQAQGAQGIGQHASRSRGAGLEFSQYRAYEPGDALRQIDWKLYARSDRFFVREAERESPLTLWVLLDATASAGQADQARPQVTRLQAMATLAACATEVALRQGDQVGLFAVHGDGLVAVPAGGGPRQRDRLWLALHGLRAGGRWPGMDALRPLWERIAAHALVLSIGDGFDQDLLGALEKLAAARREVMQLQVLTCDERDFPFSGGHRFRDQETGEELLGDGAAMRAAYLQRFGAAQRALQARWQAAGIAHAVHYLDAPPDAALRELFAHGARR
ncbi:DUF58 domain-containing protein [Xanthomonas arboricola]|uniref:DUF58 domain-containing protein n=1 Tax=Xanthomonas arboricola TaxID=56448 RepID=UPI000C85A944|nr:DUF58 domain-containing protein [Xanthomonas arboricola]MBB4707864.1 uncharacterized protein (DUF58 family) [Xanthomonas arboricola]PPT21123.1 DUF58 domain-containing protein [Xanthomonas arboricola]PPT62420.1 DUF58 domain-containing protein [Xanthomonas arboricola]